MCRQQVFTDTSSTSPYWWHAARQYPSMGHDLPERCDVVIVGAGYTGLSAALRLAKHGCSVAVLEAEHMGYGASTRNGGMVSGVLKHSPSKLATQFGMDTCRAIFREASSSVFHLERLIEDESIECEYSRCGMYFAAFTRRDFQAMASEQDDLAAVGVDTRLVPETNQQEEICSDVYYGGRILPLAGGLQPAALHQGLANAAVRHGVKLFEHMRVTQIERQRGTWTVALSKGNIRAERVLIATNGYSHGGPWPFGRRLIPIQSYVIATEPRPKEQIRNLIPNARMIQDTKNLLSYFRPSPDGTRIVFGGRASFTEIDLAESAHRLMAGLRSIFPIELEGARVSHSWRGTVGFTFDKLPHMGCEDGLYYAMGYCGQGVAMSNYLGDRVAALMLNPEQQVSIFQGPPFLGKLGYTGNPWMLPAVSCALKIKDFVNRHVLV